MVKNLKSWKINKSLKEDFAVVKTFPRAKTKCMYDYMKPAIRQKPNRFIWLQIICANMHNKTIRLLTNGRLHVVVHAFCLCPGNVLTTTKSSFRDLFIFQLFRFLTIESPITCFFCLSTLLFLLLPIDFELIAFSLLLSRELVWLLITLTLIALSLFLVDE